MLIRPAAREYRTWVMDSRRWNGFRPRSGDVVVATYPKCGTTWMQRIVSLLIFQSPEARPLDVVSPWIDMRVGRPIEDILAALEMQTHRRAVKTHLPLDGLPFYDDVRYIHVARDGRDACLSFHNHGTGFRQQMLERLDAAGLADETLARPYPRLPSDPAEYFCKWLRTGAIAGQTDGYQFVFYFEFEKTYWAERRRPNLLLVHYAELKADLAGEMRRVANFLDIEVPEEIWPVLVEAAGFQAMKQQGASLMPNATQMLVDGKDRFFNKGENGRWCGTFRKEDLDRYEAKLAATLAPACIAWLESGKCLTGDPRHTAD